MDHVMLAEPDVSGAPSVIRRVAGVMLLVAATLAVASTLHLSGRVHGRAKPFDADHAGIAEAIIGVVLAGGAIVMLRAPARARAIGIVLNSLAIVGFLIGLSMSASGGDRPDITYHLVTLPVLVASLIVLLRAKDDAPPGVKRDPATSPRPPKTSTKGPA